MMQDADFAFFCEGQALRAAGKWQEAIAAFEAASQLNPERAETLLSLGVIRLQHKELPAALALIERAVMLRPGYSQAWDALGHVQAALGDHAASFEAFSEASALEPWHLRFLVHRAEAAVQCGEAAALARIFEADLAANPLDAGPLVGLGLLAIRERRIDEAVDFLEAALALNEDATEALLLLGTAYSLSLQPARAAPMLQRALALAPDDPAIINDLSVTLARLYRYEDAVALLQANIAKRGPSVLTLSNLATAMAALGQMEQATQAAKDAMQLAPSDREPARAYCNLLPYQDGISAKFLRAALEQAASRGKPQPPPPALPAIAKDPSRKLRIGLLSNLLRSHPVGWLTVAGLEALDRHQFSIHCFGRFDETNTIANRYAQFAESWQKTETMGDRALAQCIRDEKIDILIELGGFGDAGRIDVCAHRPAPLQIKWVGMQYHSTGLPVIDYFVSDHRETPAGYEAFFTEKLLRLPDGYVCYAPPAYAPEVGALPALRKGHITFGCLNNLMKMTPATLLAWAKILRVLPDARLLLRCPQFSDPGPRERIGGFFEAQGIALERLAFSGKAQHREFLDTYNEIDIALDPFPYSGGLSTCEALLMGVPVLTRAGEIFAARHSVSHLANVGLHDWIADSDEDYVAKALQHAGDVQTLAKLRAGLRAQLRASPLWDAPRFGKNLGTALRQIWIEHCNG